MPGFNTLPAVGGGGGQANMTFVASIHMNTYNRSWAQAGTAGYYAMYSTNQENGYAYFVGSGTTTGVALNRLANISHSFTRIDVIAPQNDMLSLYKAKVKSTTVFNNAFAGFSSFPSVIQSSGNFVLPNNALPLVNLVVAGGGGGGGYGEHHRAGGGGGGGGVIKLTAFQAVGTTAITVGGAGGQQANGGSTFFGNVYALGGGGGANRNDNAPGGNIANGGGASIWGSGNRNGASGVVQTASTGLGSSGSPVYHGGHSGGAAGSTQHHQRSAGGGGAFEAGSNGGDLGGNGDGGRGHISDITGSNHSFGPGGSGNQHSGGHGTNGWDRDGLSPYAHGGRGGQDNNSNRTDGGTGVVVIRYYIP